MAKNIFNIIKKVEQKVINSENTNTIFTEANSKAELFYKNVPCEVVNYNYRYVLRPKEQTVQNYDFYKIFKHSLTIQKILKDSSLSKIVFNIDAGDIFNARGKGFTDWLELINTSFDGQKLLYSSCLVIESVSSDSDPIAELKSFIGSSFDRISESNLKLLNEWIKNGKIVLISKFTKNDLGDYDSNIFRKELNDALQKCQFISELDSKPFLPNDTRDFQIQLYKENSNNISDKLQKFINKLEVELKNYLNQCAERKVLSNFKNDYQNIIIKLDINEGSLYESLINLYQLNSFSESLMVIAKEVKILEKEELILTKLMAYTLSLHNPVNHKLELENNVRKLSCKLKNFWGNSIKEAEEAVNAYLELYSLFELNEDFRLAVKNLGVKLHLMKKQDTISDKEFSRLLEYNAEFDKIFNKLQLFCQKKGDLQQSFMKTIEAYSSLTHKIIYQSIAHSTQTNSPAQEFVHLYTQHVKNFYSKLFSEYQGILTNLEKEYKQCIDKRENAVGVGAVGVGAVGGIVLGSVGFPPLLIGSSLGAYWAYLKRKKISENFDLFKLGFNKVEEYYKQLPKELREAWADINMFPNLSKHLKDSYPEDKIYSLGKNFEGKGLDEHGQSSYWDQNSKEAMDELLNLRLKSANVEKVEILSLDYTFDGTMESAKRLAADIFTKSEDKVLIPLNLYGKHWVGIAIDKSESGKVNISYMDSERNEMPTLLKEGLMQHLTAAYPERQVTIQETEVEQQQYNDWGPATIENLVKHFQTIGDKINPEDILQSLLFEDMLLGKEINLEMALI